MKIQFSYKDIGLTATTTYYQENIGFTVPLSPCRNAKRKIKNSKTILEDA